jgi:hypothetical protein
VSGSQSAPPGLLRDRPETEFSRILARFLGAHASVRAAVFLDVEGECVDYASRLDPYEALVFSATLVNPSRALIEASASRPSGPLIQWILEAERMDALIRRIGDELFLALWLEPGGLSARVMAAIDPLVELLCRESGLTSLAGGAENLSPPASRAGYPLQVETRQAKGWGYAPQSVRGAGRGLQAVEVLGRWTEPGALEAHDAVCFRVRTADQEWTLVHDPGLQRWYRR